MPLMFLFLLWHFKGRYNMVSGRPSLDLGICNLQMTITFGSGIKKTIIIPSRGSPFGGCPTFSKGAPLEGFAPSCESPLGGNFLLVGGPLVGSSTPWRTLLLLLRAPLEGAPPSLRSPFGRYLSFF